ncbi:hypothetical protein VTI74DRAFT_2641 [Chaetomium olivicolor]
MQPRIPRYASLGAASSRPIVVIHGHSEYEKLFLAGIHDCQSWPATGGYEERSMFLIDYAAHDPGCLPLFKQFLVAVVPKPGAGEDPVRKVEYNLANPGIRRLGLTPTFKRELKLYIIYYQVFPSETSLEFVLPFAPIPEQYQRVAEISPAQATDIGEFIETLGGILQVLPDEELPDRGDLLPKAIVPRPPSPVNKMLVDRPDDVHHHTRPLNRPCAMRTSVGSVKTQPRARRLSSHNLRLRFNNPSRPLVFPSPGAVLRKACETADGPQWTPPRLECSQLPEKLETMQATIAYRERLKHIKKMLEPAKLRAEDGFQRDRRWAVAGEFSYRAVPQDVKLASDEWEKIAKDTIHRFIDPKELPWLRFLAGECVNGKNWTGRFLPDTPKDKYKLFLIFARRVQKLLDDEDPKRLFSRHNNEVTVEELLEAINVGKDSGAVTKYGFQPYDACSWLGRMKGTGYVRSRLDLACYGVVQWHNVEFFPEHRVTWSAAGNSCERPKYHLEYIADWNKVILKRASTPGSPGASSLHLPNTYRNPSRSGSRPAPPSKAQIRNPTPPAEKLDIIRTKIIDEISANETMLAPGRKHTYFDRNGQPHTLLIRDHNWDWASLAARPDQAAAVLVHRRLAARLRLPVRDG